MWPSGEPPGSSSGRPRRGPPPGLRPLVRLAVLIGVTFAVGVCGYAYRAGPGHGWFDALYFTVITLTTVGYAGTIELSTADGDAGARAGERAVFIGGAEARARMEALASAL